MQELINKLEARVSTLESKLAEIGSDLKTNNSTTQEIRDILDAAKGAFKVLDWGATAFKWIAGLGLMIAAVWAALKDVHIFR